jgi:choloylglycine hydrolase
MCQSFLLKSSAATPDYVVGRSMEFAPLKILGQVVVPWNVCKVPANTFFTCYFSQANLVAEPIGWTWKNTYNFIGITSMDSIIREAIFFKYKIHGTFTTEGINEKGLSASMLVYDVNMTWETNKKGGRDIFYLMFIDWVLGCCSTVQDVKDAFVQNKDAGAINLFGLIGDAGDAINQPFHFIMHDANGDCVIVEVDNKEAKLYDKEYWAKHNLTLYAQALNGPLYGQMTNAPSIDWHFNNLRQYLNLNPHDTPDVANSKMKQFSHGSGMVGLPGDYTSPSRFVKLSNFLRYAVQPKDLKAAIILANHILNAITIIDGLVYEEEIGDFKQDITEWVAIKKLSGSPEMYCRTYNASVLSAMYVTFDFNNFPSTITFTILKNE